MTMDYKFGDGQIIEYEILTEPQTNRLIDTVMDAMTGKTQIDYQMRGEWVQLKPKTLIDRVKLRHYEDGWKSVGLRQVKSKTPEIRPPQVIVRHRRKAFNKVKRALELLAKHDIITTYTLRGNGYIWVKWFDGYVQTERISFKRWVATDVEWEMISEDRVAIEYLRDRISFCCQDAKAQGMWKEE